MAIKTIINNTEKEIEQIKNSDEQDVDYVYSRIGDTEVEGEPPISIKSIGGELTDYRIYGRTSRNLFDGEFLQGCWAYADGTYMLLANWTCTTKIACIGDTAYTFSFDNPSRWAGFVWFDINKNFISADNRNSGFDNGGNFTATSPSNAAYMVVDIASYPNIEDTITPSDVTDFMLVEGSTALPYEPYGESVGNRTVNLFDENSPEIQNGVYVDNSGTFINSVYHQLSPYITCIAKYTYRLYMERAIHSNTFGVYVNLWDSNKQFIKNIYVAQLPSAYQTLSISFIPSENGFITFNFLNNADITKNVMLYKSSTALPYEPYGYKVPVMISNGIDTQTIPIYLPEQIKKVGDEAEYISYADQKMHRIGADDINITLPALSTIKGTNTLSVNTSIQPSNIYIKDSFDYKKVFTATRAIEDETPLNYRSIEDSDSTLKNYRIYGRTSRNLFDMKKFAELCYPRYASVTFADNTLSFTSTAVDAYVNYVCGEGDTVSDIYRPSCIDVLPSTTYTISMSSMPKCYISWINSSYKGVSAYTRIPDNQSSYTFTTPENCTKLLFRLGKVVTNIGDTFTISNVMLNSGSTALPYEPYGESVGDRTGNLFDGEFLQGYWAGADGAFVVSDKWICTNKLKCKSSTTYTFSFNTLSRWYGFAWYDSNGMYISSSISQESTTQTLPIIYTAISPANAAYFGVNIAGYPYNTNSILPTDVTDLMIVEGSTALPYEPYGYKVPLTISNGIDTQTIPIYLPEQIKKVGDEAEYIDYSEQKMHRVRANLSEVNEFSNSITDTSNKLTIWVQQGKDQSFVYPSQLNIFTITEPTTITTYITITNDNDSIRIKHNGSQRDIVIAIVRGLSYGVYSVSFNVLNYDHTTVGGVVINNIMVNKGSAPFPYEPYIENTDIDVTLPALPMLAGTNTLSIETEVKPSKITVKGHIK